MTDTHTLHRGTDTRGVEYLLTTWADGSLELATRTPAESSWSPPITLRGPLNTPPLPTPRQPEHDRVRP